jgi:stress response protein SCP2
VFEQYAPAGQGLHEACAAGLAVVSTDVVGAAAELVRDGPNWKFNALGAPFATDSFVELLKQFL